MDPHPITGVLIESPAPPGAGWPDDPAGPDTPIATTAQQVRELAVSAPDLATLAARSSVCRACPRLVEWREAVAITGRRASFAHEPYWGRPSPSFGDPNASVLVVGLAPAANGGNRTGRMFTGDHSGDFLYAALHRTGFANQPTSVGAGDGLLLTGMRLTPAVHCAPPANKPTPGEQATCAPWLDRELQLLPGLRTIMTLGGIGWAAALGAIGRQGWRVPTPKPKFGHGVRVVIERPDLPPIALVGCYHVSPHNTFTGRLTAAMLDELLASLR